MYMLKLIFFSGKAKETKKREEESKTVSSGKIH